MNLKKILTLGVILSMVMMVASAVSPAQAEISDECRADLSACTADELTEYIAELMGQLDDLNDQLAGLGDGEEPSGSGACPTACDGITSFDRNLKQGMTGADVKCLQAMLNMDEDTQVAESSYGSPGEETEYFGSLTHAAVVKFQEKYADDVLAYWGLTSGTGFFGSTSRAKMDELLEDCAEVVMECADYENEEDCEDADCYWYDDACHEEEELVCSDYETEEDCPSECYWYDDACNAEAPTCEDYETEEDCPATCYWYSDACNEALPDNETDCEAAGYYWYESVCHEEPSAEAALTVELDDETPAAGSIYVDTTVPAGSAHNVMTKVKFVAGPDPVTVNGMTVTKYGTAANGAVDIARVKVYDGETQIGSRVLVTNSANFTFAPKVQLDAGDEKVLDVVIDLTGAAASVTRTVAMGIAAATDVNATGSTITPEGVFPVVGNYMTISQGTFGSLTVTAGANPPATTPSVGEDDRILGNFIISAGANEDLTLVSVTYTDNGTTADGDITDIKVKAGTEELGTAGAFSNRRAVVPMNKDLSRGSSLVTQVTGDITAGVNRFLTLTLVAPDAVLAKGKTSGVYFIGPAANVAMPATAAFAGGVLTVTPNTNSPTDNLVSAPVAQDIGIFDVRGAGENVVLQTITLTFARSANMSADYNAALFDGDGGLLSNIAAVDAVVGDPNPDAVAFTLAWTVAPATTQELHVKAYTNVLAAGDAGTAITVAVGINGFVGIGEQSGAAVRAPVAGFALPAVTYRHAGSMQFALNTVVAPLNQAALIPSSGNYWTAITAIATREDVTITVLQLNDLIAETTQAFNTCSLYDMATDGTLTNLDTQPWNFVALAGNSNVVFNNINAGSGVTVPMGAANAKTLVVKCSVSGLATDGDAPELDIIDDDGNGSLDEVTAVGAVSSLNIPNGAGAGAAPTYGNYTVPNLTGAEVRGKHTLFDPAGANPATTAGVLYVAPNASAPSGDISRSATATMGIWDFTAQGAAVAFDPLGGVGAGALDHNPLVFHCYTGTVFNNSATFRLVDATTGLVYAVNGATVPATTTDVTFEDRDFENGNALAVLQGQTVSVKLQENITNTGNYNQYTTLQFGIDGAADVDTGADAGVNINNAGGLPNYPSGGLEAKCPEVRIY
jgi:hypothetical protein